jgi:hypothetical protein
MPDRDNPPEIADQVAEIVRDYEGGRRLRELGAEHGISKETVRARLEGATLRPRGPRVRVDEFVRRDVRVTPEFRDELRRRGPSIAAALLATAAVALDAGAVPVQSATGSVRVRPRIDGELWRRAEQVGQGLNPPRGAGAALVALARAGIDLEKSRGGD